MNDEGEMIREGIDLIRRTLREGVNFWDDQEAFYEKALFIADTLCACNGLSRPKAFAESLRNLQRQYPLIRDSLPNTYRWLDDQPAEAQPPLKAQEDLPHPAPAEGDETAPQPRNPDLSTLLGLLAHAARA